MKHMNSGQVRQAFLDFFAENGHRVVASSSLVPGNDPTLLFTNAGMVQFKDVFLGLDKRPYKRAATSQKCMRISGKHNDLENVGPSPRHHTFFEMLGNFSFGDYFKRDAIHYAFNLLTKVYEIPVDSLYYTVYRDDDEAYSIWTEEVKVNPERVLRMGPKTNFWQMADTGPCGPTSEVHYDWGKEACTCHDPNCGVELDNGCERWLEIWNLVFMQFNRLQADPAHTGKFDQPLPAPGVDTGMGLERILAVLQGARANYDTDLFAEIMDATQEVLGHDDAFRSENYIAYRVIADHTRAATFLIADGVNPGTTGREYVTRMLIRRAWRFAHSMGVDQPFLNQVADVVIAKMGTIYPELTQFQTAIRYQISAEEERFIRMLDNALEVLQDKITELKNANKTSMSGHDAFFLYSTHGLPLEITRDLLNEQELYVDETGFRDELERHRAQVRDESALITSYAVYQDLLQELAETSINYDPYNYDRLRLETKVLAVITDGKRVKSAQKGHRVEVVLQDTPFYVESGGQVSDTGTITGTNFEVAVDGMARPIGGLIVHHGTVMRGKIVEGSRVTATVDTSRRWDIMRNHTATHLIHATLRHVLGEHVRQKGSLVAPDRLRFDFAHNQPLTQEEIGLVSDEVNRVVLENQPIIIRQKALEEARREGAMALFGEKYGEVVRTVTVPTDDQHPFSYELCGGTHVRTTSEIGSFVVVGESGPGAGIRRIVAVTGSAAQHLIQERTRTLETISKYLGTEGDLKRVEERVAALVKELEVSRDQLRIYERQTAKLTVESLTGKAQTVDGAKIVTAVVSASNADLLAEMADWCRDRMKSGAVVLGSEIEGTARLVAKVTPDLVKRGVSAGKIVAHAAKFVDGNGGGGPDFARAGGKSPQGLDEAISEARKAIARALTG